MYKYLLLGCVLLVTLVPAAGAEVTCVDGWCKGPATELAKYTYLRHDGSIGIDVSEHSLETMNLDCSLLSGRYLVLKQDNQLFQEIYAGLLTALSSDWTITIAVETESIDCEVTYVLLWSPREGS